MKSKSGVARTDLGRALFDESDDVAVVADSRGKFISVNKRAVEVSGYSEDEIDRLHLSHLLLAADPADPCSTSRTLDVKALYREARGGSAKTSEGALRRKDGSTLPVEVRTRALPGARMLVTLRDVTERRLMADSEWKFRSLVESAHDVIFISDAAGRFAYVNRAGAETLGMTQAEVIGKTVDELFPPHVAAKYRAGVEQVIHTGEDRITHELLDVDGRTIWFHSLVQPVRDRQGRVTAAQGLIRNITNLKETEASLRQSDERLRQVVRVAHIGIFDHDHATGEIYWSPEQREIYGWGQDESVSFDRPSEDGRRTWDLIHPEDRDRVAEAIHRAHTSQDGLFDIEYRILRRDGSLRWLTTRSQTFFAGEGENRHPVRTIGAVRDVTAMKEAERALRESEERLRQATRVASIGIFDHDHRTGTLYMSPTMREISRVPPEASVSGRDFSILDGRMPKFLSSIHPEDRDRVTDAFKRAHEPGDGVYDVEYRHLWPDGTMQWVSVRSQTFFEGQGESCRPLRTVGACVDVSERRLAQEEQARLRDRLVQAQKMEWVGRLAGGVAHDFNNMLNVIGGYAELALAQIDSTSPLYGPLQEIENASRRSAELTRQLLAFARRQAVRPKVLDLNELVDGSLNMLRRLIGEDIRLVWRPGRQLWSVRIDPAQIDQILVNLVVNARDAIAGPGQVIVRTHNITIDRAYCAVHPGSVPGDYVTLEVVDDGRGMDEDTKSHVFEPFFTTKGEGRGTGLGLATVYGIVKQNDGFISVESDPGRGTTMRVLLPRAVGDVAGAEFGEERAQKGSETLLLVEDEPMVLGLSTRLLETLGYTVLPASTPSQAVQVAQQRGGRIDLLVTDVVMPEISGQLLAELLRSMYPGLKCLFVSGYFPGSSKIQNTLGEGSHFLQKPFTRNDLAAKVREALDAKAG